MEYQLTERQRFLVFSAISHYEDYLTEAMNSPDADPIHRPGREAAIKEIQSLYSLFRRKVTTLCPHCQNALFSNQEYWTCFSCDVIYQYSEVDGPGER